ncbi:hypothetical protein [Marinobacter sp. HN1S83]|uniref:hypothetical protein n=1 Tax=Marinobacter sp. HN1S83 TaxID=3382301 RepID=UPI00387AB7A4
MIKKGGSEEVYQWGIRIHKSLKEVFTATSFYQEALIAKEANSWAAFFFLSYYSLFHSLMSCVVLLPSESIENLSKITHTKLIKLFKAQFSDQKPHMIREDIGDVFYMFKYLREYYSYNMPPNDFLYELENSFQPDKKLPFFIRSCIQLASLHSEIIERCFEKHGSTKKNLVPPDDIKNWYKLLNCPKQPLTEEHVLHFSDRLKMNEVLSAPDPVSFSVILEHFIDEFRLYEGAQFPKFADGTEIDPGKFVYKVLRG